MKTSLFKIWPCIVLVFFSCSEENVETTPTHEQEPVHIQNESGWLHEFPGIGVYSSPRVTDLNQDGVGDVILGAGKLEFQKTDSAVIAISGATGDMLWNVPARDQVFGSATLLDINRDGVNDVLIGGRSAVLMAINGINGDAFWEFFEKNREDEGALEPDDYGWYNFYNAQLVPDQTGDGLEEILISNGGDVTVAAFNPDRPVGKLMVIDANNGSLIVQADMPDGKETYMSPVAFKLHEDDQDLTILFGTGGETIGGSLYRTTLSELMKGDLSGAKQLLSSEKSGFIAPPVLADINRNGYYDIVVNSLEGNFVAIDGKENTRIWENEIEGIEAYGALSVGHFNDDEIPDFFTTSAEGSWPNYEESVQLMIDGKTGEAEFQSSSGIGQISSPVIVDVNDDGFDEAIISLNFTRSENQEILSYNMLIAYNFRREDVFQVAGANQGFNLASTPWIGDLDDDGMLDIVSVHLTDTQNRFAMNGFRIIRLKTDLKLSKEIKWGAYMGSHYDGVYR